jgi:voltage-gated potassium channel
LSGRSAAGELIRRGEDPARIVVIDHAETALVDAAESGMVGLRGDATRESLLVDANIHAARTAIVCLGRDDTSVLCTLTMRGLAPELRIIAMVKEAENERLLQRGGASATICPSTVSGILMANSITSSHVASYVHDMLTIDGRVTLAERVALATDIGLRPTELRDGIALRIHRGDAVIGFWETEARVQEGDRLLIVAPRVNFDGASAAP